MSIDSSVVTTLRATGAVARRQAVSRASRWVFLVATMVGVTSLLFLGYDTIADDKDLARHTIAYYDRRTSHGSTLSLVAHAAVLAGIDPESSWERFLVAVESDFGDVQNGTTKEGIHLGVMAGTLDLVQRCYSGMHIRDGVLCFDPRLAGPLDQLSFSMQFQGTPIMVTFDDGRLTLAVHPEGESPSIRVAVHGQVCDLRAGDRRTFDLRPEPAHDAKPATPTAPTAPAAGQDLPPG